MSALDLLVKSKGRVSQSGLGLGCSLPPLVCQHPKFPSLFCRLLSPNAFLIYLVYYVQHEIRANNKTTGRVLIQAKNRSHRTWLSLPIDSTEPIYDTLLARRRLAPVTFTDNVFACLVVRGLGTLSTAGHTQ